MIVKNEASVIIRALESVKHIVDNICICDTGSTDGTQDIINTYLEENNINGKIFKRGWKNFGHNRTQCFNLAQKTFKNTDYLMTLDADEVIVPWEEIPLMDKKLETLPTLEGDIVYIPTVYQTLTYHRGAFFKESLNWEWRGVLHEYPYADNVGEIFTLSGVCNIPYSDGARSANSNKYLNDAKVFERELKKDPTDSRNWFYLAQSYADAGKPELGMDALDKVIELTEWEEEKFISLLRKARYKRRSEVPFDKVLKDYLAAYEHSPHRLEPLYDIIAHYRTEGLYFTASVYLEKALHISYPDNVLLFVEPDVYKWKIQDEASLIYYYTGEPVKALTLLQHILQRPGIPDGDRERMRNNVGCFEEAIKVMDKGG